MNRNCCTNSVPYGYGGRRADTSVFPVRTIMSPPCSSRFLVGKTTRSAAARTTRRTPPRQKPMSCLTGAPEGTVVRQAAGGARRAAVAITGAFAAKSGYVPFAVRAWRTYVVTAGLLAFAGCGGGERQDANEPS